jgi:stringent starvation protein B
VLSNKPYLIRAFYQWILDSGCTPYVVINATSPRCRVPVEYIENGEITLNISPIAVRNLNITNDLLEFSASFSGVIHFISAPTKAILAIYANENQQGMFFDYEDITDDDAAGTSGSQDQQNNTAVNTSNQKNRSHLKLVE